MYSFYISLHNLMLNQPEAMEFIRFGNYLRLLNDPLFLRSMGLTLYFVGLSVFLQLIVGMAMALVLNEPLKGRGWVRALLVLPWALPGTVVGGIWRWIYHADYGLINGLLRILGVLKGSLLWLGPGMALNAVVFAEVWRMAPFAGLMLLAGLATIPRQLYDAARVDGATGWQIFWYITLPLLKPTIGIILVMRTMFAFQNLELVYVLTKGGPGTQTYLLPYYMYTVSFNQLQAGYGSAMAYGITILIALVCGIYLLTLSLSERRVEA